MNKQDLLIEYCITELVEIIEARIEEIFTLVNKDLTSKGLKVTSKLFGVLTVSIKYPL